MDNILDVELTAYNMHSSVLLRFHRAPSAGSSLHMLHSLVGGEKGSKKFRYGENTKTTLIYYQTCDDAHSTGKYEYWDFVSVGIRTQVS